jgi:sec-independent protein translocase protein TatB
MFDIGFGQLVAIALVALLVIGPQRLPKVARTLGHLFGRMQRYVNDVKADISREMELEELRKLQASVEEAAQSINRSVSQQLNETESELNKLADLKAPESASRETPGSASTAAAVESPPASQLELGLDSDPRQQKQA